MKTKYLPAVTLALLVGSASFFTSCTKEAPISAEEVRVNAVQAEQAQVKVIIDGNSYLADVVNGTKKPMLTQPTIIAPDSLPIALIAWNYSGVSAKGFDLSVWYCYGTVCELIANSPHAAKDGVCYANIYLGKDDKIWVKLSCEYGVVWIPTVQFNKLMVVAMPGTNVAFTFGSM